MIVALNCPDIPLYQSGIHEYEKGTREPPLPVLLRYARLANVYLDVLVDDELDLPAQLHRHREHAVADAVDSAKN